MSNYTLASQQWASRPADERFWTLSEMSAVCGGMRSRSRDYAIPASWLSVSGEYHGAGSVAPSLCIQSPRGEMIVRPTHHAMSQLCRLVGAPMEFVGQLSGELAGRVLNERIESYAKGATRNQQSGNSDDTSSDCDWNSVAGSLDIGNGDTNDDTEVKVMLMRDDGGEGHTLRSITTRSYGRIWNDDVIRRCERLIEQGWRVPPSRPSGNERADQIRVATSADILRSSHPTLGVREGQKIGPSLFASDRDMFVTLVDDSRPVMDDNGNELYRALVVSNSEVGNLRAFVADTMLFRSVCSNVIFWQTSNLVRTKIVHKGKYAQRKALDAIEALDVDSDELALSISAARQHIIGKNADEVLAEVFGRKLASKAETQSAMRLAELDCDTTDLSLNPFSVWGLSQGFTRLAQSQVYADARDRLNRVPRALLALAK